MDKDVYTVALNNTLNEIKSVCPNINYSFIFTKDGLVVAADEKAARKTMEKAMISFQNLEGKADAIGGLNNFLVNGKDGRIVISNVNDMYLTMVTTENADIVHLQSVARIIVPTILKLLETITPTPLKPATSYQLVVDTLTGFFVGNSVEIDPQVWNQWSETMDEKDIEEVEIESFSGKATKCKAKPIDNQKLKGKGIIRIPEKICNSLAVKKGEVVKVKPRET